ncbi:MAG: V-type ATP synthase subunit I [Oscillospiraceae bacterium]|nr:V-type ATP synthase subunit I [Oscillospiraceae bacterium]
MAIVRMQKLHLLAPRSQRDAIMSSLQMLGCAEVKEQSGLLSDERLRGLINREKSDYASLRREKSLFADAVKLLDKYAPDPPPFLSAKPIMREAELMDESKLGKSKEIAEKIVALDESIRNHYLEESSLDTLIEVLTPWVDFPVALDYTGSAKVAMRLGTIPTVSDFESLQASLAEKVPETELSEVSFDEHTRFLCIFYYRPLEAEVMDILHSYGFAVPPFGEVKGTAREMLDATNEKLREIRLARSLDETRLVSFAQDRQLMMKAYDLMSTREAKAEAMENLVGTSSTVCLDAWITEPEREKLIPALEKFDCAYMFEDPSEEEYPSVPVKLKNNFFTQGLNMVTNMYSLPQYGTVDPNPLMAPFFILFYGLMMADMGYGLLMIAASLVAMKKMRPKDGMLHFCNLLFWGGIATFVVGAFTGGLFGDAPYQIVHMLNPESTWQGLPALFSPLEDTIMILIVSIILGFIHLNTGLAISFIQKVKKGDVLDGLFYEASLWVIFLGAILMVLGSMVLGVEMVKTAGIVVLIIGVLALFYGGTRGKKGFGKVTAIFGLLYNELTGWFGDLLSYSRIMALMLAGAVIAQVFNTIGAMFGNVILFIIVFIIGHALNFGLNLLGCYVHDLRLQCLEYFGKFYTDGGKAFKPLKINSKYFEISK